jgi:hypothetical protein
VLAHQSTVMALLHDYRLAKAVKLSLIKATAVDVVRKRTLHDQ